MDRITANGIGSWSSRQRSPLGRGGTLEKALYEILRRKKAKQIAESYVDSRKIQGLDIVEGSVPSETVEEPLASLA
jgi:hypothetical protein